nr:diaminopimelate decarboxylase [Mycolicibacterium mengxianglii]
MTLLDILPSLRAVLSPPVDPARWPHTTAIDPAGRLTIGGVALADIAGEFGTPTHVVDETDFRNRARRYRKELPGTKVLYSDRTPLIPAIARWAGEENLGVEARSGTELATALNGGVHPARIVFHGSAQSRAELSDAVAAGVGRIVVDSAEDVACLAGLVYRTQHVLVRFIPGRRMAATIAALHTAPKLTLAGLHGHIGADITGVELYSAAVRRMVGAMADVRRAHKQVLGELNIGGGHTMTHPELGVRQLAVFLDDALDTACAAERFPRPLVVIAPGRAVIARAGVTLYRVQAVHSHAIAGAPWWPSKAPATAPAAASGTTRPCSPTGLQKVRRG